MISQTDTDRLAARLIERGLAGMPEPELLERFCTEAAAAGLPLCRAVLIVDTLHPIYEGRAFRWRDDDVEEEALVEYAPTEEGEAAENWRRSTFYHLDVTGETELRRRVGEGHPDDFRVLAELRAEGRTDYFACMHRFAGDDVIGGMDCVYSSWISDHPDGFSDGDLDALRRLVPSLALAVKGVSLGRVAKTLVEVYLGRDAGARVLAGRIRRGVADKIRAVLWFSDLRSFTTITDSADPREILPLLNDYADAVISAVHAGGGDVLKLVGDGTLAIFPVGDGDPDKACRAALAAEADMRRRLVALNARRKAEGRPVTSVTLGLHIGEVLYGNIGADDRLDFTVVGPAVNEVSRIASLCRSVDRTLLLSAEFEAAAPEAERADLVSVGRFALRGVGRAQHLYTLDPGRLAGAGGNASPSEGLPLHSHARRDAMSNTPKTQADTDAIDASISVLGEQAGEPKAAPIDGTASHPAGPDAVRPSRGAESGRQSNLEAPIEESAVDGAGRGGGAESVERPGNDPGV